MFAGALAALAAFLVVARAVFAGLTAALDEALLLALRAPGDVADPLGPRWVEELGRDFTALGGNGILTLVTLLAVFGLAATGRRRLALSLALSVGGALVASLLLKEGFDRPRPDLVPHGSNVYTSSFPSGHSMMSAVVWLSLASLASRLGGATLGRIALAAAVLVVGLVGLSRVYLGVHWPTDVAAGWLAGAAWVLLWHALTARRLD